MPKFTFGFEPESDFIAETKAIRDGRTEPPEPNSLSAKLAIERGEPGSDPINDRAEEAQEWCERIMKSERRERLLEQYYGTEDLWLYHRLSGVLDDCRSRNPTDRLMISHNPVFGRRAQSQHGVYAADFGMGIDVSEPVFNLGGVVIGVLAGAPQNVCVFSSTYTPVHYHHVLKSGGVSPGWYRDEQNRLQRGTAVGLGNTCDWHLVTNCENRPRFLLSFPLGNWIVFYATCNPCAGELANKI